MTIFDLVARERERVVRLVRVDTGVKALVVAGAVFVAGAVVLGGARWIALPKAVPFLIWVIALGLVAFVARRGRRIGAEVASTAAVSEAVERENKLRDGSVRGVMELAHDGGAFVRLAAQRLGAQLEHAGLVIAPALEQRLVKRTARGAAVLLPVILVAVLSASRAGDGWSALAHPVDAWRGTLLPKLDIGGAPHRALRGSNVSVTVAAHGRSAVSLRRRTTGNAWVETALHVEGGQARAEFGPLDADLTLVASDGRALSDTVVVRVVDRPFLGDVGIVAVYPSYLRRANQSLPRQSPLALPPRPHTAPEGHASEPLAAVTLSQGEDSTRLTPADRRFSGRLVPVVSGSWSWSARGLSTAIADVPAPLSVQVVPDSAPAAEILSPGSDSLVAATDRIELQLLASDDHSLGLVSLKVWTVRRDGRPDAPRITKLTGGGTADWAGEFVMELSQLGLDAGDAVHVQMIARDESPWSQEGVSRELTLRIPGRRRPALAGARDGRLRGGTGCRGCQSHAKPAATYQRCRQRAHHQARRDAAKGCRADDEVRERAADQVACR